MKHNILKKIFWESTFTLCLIVGSLLTLSAQEEEEYVFSKVLQYKDAVYDPAIKTVILRVRNTEVQQPALRLNSNAQLELTFDELGDEAYDYRFTLIHCNADWTPSDLQPFDYIDGFSEGYIDNYEFSFNTKQDYTHYRLLVPNQDLRLTKSGNYLLKVYSDADEDDLILSRRFVVFEPIMEVGGDVYTSSLNNYFDTHQRLQSVVNIEGFNIGNPLSDVTVHILQNGRWDNALLDLKPTFIRGPLLEFSYFDRMLFEGGNEFRFFDTRSLRYKRQHVDKITKIKDENHVSLEPDYPRTRSRRFVHMNSGDYNGQFFISRFENTYTTLDADYAHVHFSLPMDSAINDGNIYVFGALSDWALKPDFQMHYNRQKRAYEANIYLKQGRYDYQYVVERDGGTELDASLIEGNYYNTENDYTILVYYRSFNAQYDRLVGLRTVKSVW